MVHTFTGLKLACRAQRTMLYIGIAGPSELLLAAAARVTMSLYGKGQKPSLSHNSETVLSCIHVYIPSPAPKLGGTMQQCLPYMRLHRTALSRVSSPRSRRTSVVGMGWAAAGMGGGWGTTRPMLRNSCAPAGCTSAL